MCLCGFERLNFRNGTAKSSINTGRYTVDYLLCGDLPYPAWKKRVSAQDLRNRRIRRYFVCRLKRPEARDFSHVRFTQTYCNLSLGAQKKITNGYGAGFCEGVREAFSKQDQEKEKEWSLILRLPKEVIDFCDKFNTGQGNMYDTPIDFRKFSSGYLDGKCFGEQKRLQPARHASTI